MHIHSKRIWRHLAFLFICSCFSSVQADIRPNVPPRPDPTPTPAPVIAPVDGKTPKLQLTTDADVQTARLKLPRSVIDALTKQTTDPVKHADAGISPTATVIAGTSLSIAIVLGGLMLVRGQAGRRRWAAVLIITAGAGIFASTLLADLPPRPVPPTPPVPKPAPIADIVATDVGSIPVEVEVVNDGPIQLTLPSKQAEAFLAPKAAAPGK